MLRCEICFAKRIEREQKGAFWISVDVLLTSTTRFSKGQHPHHEIGYTRHCSVDPVHIVITARTLVKTQRQYEVLLYLLGQFMINRVKIYIHSDRSDILHSLTISLGQSRLAHLSDGYLRNQQNLLTTLVDVSTHHYTGLSCLRQCHPHMVYRRNAGITT